MGSFCSQMPYLSPTSAKGPQDLILSSTTNTLLREGTLLPFMSALRRQYYMQMNENC